MAYPDVPIETRLTALKVQIDAARQRASFNVQHWDGEVLKVLTTECAKAEHNVSTSNQVAQVQKNLAQQAINLVVGVLKKKELSKEDLQLIEELPGSLQKNVNRITEDSQDLMDASGEYRGGWPDSARELLSPAAKPQVALFAAKRTGQIDGQAAIKALKQRIQEYIPRAQEFVKQAKQRASGGQIEVKAFDNDMQAIKKKMEDGRDVIKELHFKKERQIQGITQIEQTKVWSADQSKSAKAVMGGICADAKNARGHLKTLEVLFEGLRKRGKAAGAGWKDMAAKAVSQAELPLKEAQAASKAFSADEDECKKICKNHGVPI